MKLQGKAAIFVCAILAIALVVVGMFGYRNAEEGFEHALKTKANHDLQTIAAVIDARFPGEWEKRADGLYKGNKKFDGDFDLLDELGRISGNNVTIFSGDTRVATTFQKEGKRAVGTKASDTVIKQVLQENKKFSGFAEILGNQYLSAYTPIKGKGGENVGMLFVGIPTQELDAIQSSFIKQTVAIIAAILLLASIFSWFIIGKMSKRINEIDEQMALIADGDLTGKDLYNEGKDEIADLAKSANIMKNKVKKLMENITTSAQTVAASSEELTASSQQTGESITMVANSAMKMAENVGEQSSIVDNLQEKTMEMENKMVALKDESERMGEAAQATSRKAADGKETATQAVGEMDYMAQQVSDAADMVDALGARSKEIGQIIDTISGIADQTNLLALNAAIEAARAGEAGRGFSVVAEEVRKLAEQSGNAAKSISSMISAIQDDTNKAVAAIRRGNEAVQSGKDKIEATGRAFDEIVSQVEELATTIDGSIGSIKQAVETNKETLEAMNTVKSSSTAVEDEAQTVSAATEEQAASIHEITTASRALAELAQGLQNEVVKFKI